MNTIGKLIILSSLALGCATTQTGRAPVADLRGDVVVRGPSVKAVIVGPADIHAYSAFAGGTIYAARAVSGGDADCRAAGAGHVALEADRVHVVRVEAGQVACLATQKPGSFELLWHGHEQKDAAVNVAATGSPQAR